MAVKKDLNKAVLNATSQISNLGNKTEQVADKIIKNEVKTPVNVVKFKKPNGDYYKLDLVKRKVVLGGNGHDIIIEEIDKDYKTYLQSVCGSDGMAKYIHKLIEQDAKKNGYKWE